MRELSLFSGYGGFSLGLKLSGINTRTVAYVEWEKYPQEIIKARINDGILDDAPVFGDVSTFNGEQFRGLVDIITAGFPCPPFSQAGKRRGTDDPRNKWPDTLRVISEVRPKYVLLENVPGILTASKSKGTPSYGAVVVGQLAEVGYDCFWEVIGADDVGAPHRRKRWICFGVLGNPQSERGERRGSGERGEQAQCTEKISGWDGSGDVVNPSSGRHRESQEEVRTGGNTLEYADGNVAHDEGGGHRGGTGAQRGVHQRIVQSEEQGRSEVGSEVEGRSRELGNGDDTGDSSPRLLDQPNGEWTTEAQEGQDQSLFGSSRPVSATYNELADGSVEGLQGGIGNHSGEERQTGPPVAHAGTTVRSQTGRSSRDMDKELADGDSQRGRGGATDGQHAEDVGESSQSTGCDRGYPQWPPRPNDTDGWRSILTDRPDLAPALTKDALASICGVADGPTHRVNRLKATGNGIVPLVVTAFLRRLKRKEV